MLFSKKIKHSPIKTASEFLGSTHDKVIHSTEHPCSVATSIDPNHRWYIRTIPRSGEYIKCSKCYPNTTE